MAEQLDERYQPNGLTTDEFAALPPYEKVANLIYVFCTVKKLPSTSASPRI